MAKTKSQVAKFREAARDLDAGDSERRFNERLEKIARQKPRPTKKEAAAGRPLDRINDACEVNIPSRMSPRTQFPFRLPKFHRMGLEDALFSSARDWLIEPWRRTRAQLSQFCYDAGGENPAIGGWSAGTRRGAVLQIPH